MNESVNIKYDKFISAKNNSWLIEINKQHHFFPYSLCILDEDSKIISCPMWFAIRTGVESYIDED